MLGLQASNRARKPEDGGDILRSLGTPADVRTVLVIDDEIALLAIISDVLEENGFKVLAVPDGPAGLEIIRSAEPIDLLMTDIRLPKGMNGREVATAARQIRPDLKVLFMTGYAGTALAGSSPLEEGMELMTKPFDLVHLAARVERLIDD